MVGPGPAITTTVHPDYRDGLYFSALRWPSWTHSFFNFCPSQSPPRRDQQFGATSPMPAEHIDGLLAGRIQHTEVINILQRRTRFFGLFFALYCPEPIEQTQLKSGQ